MTIPKEQLQKLYDGSACTMLGYQPDELHLYIEQLQENDFLKDGFRIYETTGQELNDAFELSDKLPDGLNVFIIDLNDMKDISKFAVGLRLQMGYRWLDDVVNNRKN